MVGYGSHIFKPGADISRAMLAVMLWRLSGSPQAEAPLRFTDVAPGSWYAEAVRWADQEGVAVGYGGGLFGPEDPLTREQMAVIFRRYAHLQGLETEAAGAEELLAAFPDGERVSAYAREAVGWACGKNMMLGMWEAGSKVLAPKERSSRAQAATVMMRYVEQLLKERAAG